MGYAQQQGLTESGPCRPGRAADGRKETAPPAGGVYDGSCESCIRDRVRYERWAGEQGKEICWFDITDREDVLLSLGISPQQALQELHVQTAEGEIFRSWMPTYY
ncbi:hypothetical protein MBH78_22315 [Oceanimonas sp. NS1]|nr:hypothetical protein [Oceanimonas sp. NS1]